MAWAGLVIAVLLLSASSSAEALSTAQAKAWNDAIIKSIDGSNGPQGQPRWLIGTFLRLAFHDCAGPGGCNGCLNAGLDANKGLQAAINALEVVRATPGLATLSRADMWALAGLVAAQYGASNRPPPPPPGTVYVPSGLKYTAFKTGRKDCATTPNDATETSADFPSSIKGLSDTTSYFATKFAFSATESVTILGAHSLGTAKQGNSGFRGPWDDRHDVLSNNYYQDLRNPNAGWAQQFIQSQAPVKPGTPPKGVYQWQRTDSQGRNFMMLDADMCLFKNMLTPDSQGKVSCTYSTCAASTTASTVNTYADNPNTFLDAFATVLAKMQNVCGRNNGAMVACTLALLTA